MINNAKIGLEMNSHKNQYISCNRQGPLRVVLSLLLNSLTPARSIITDLFEKCYTFFRWPLKNFLTKKGKFGKIVIIIQKLCKKFSELI